MINSEQRYFELGRRLLKHKEDILRVWTDLVRGEVSGANSTPTLILRDHLPQFLNEMATDLCGGTAQLTTSAKRHADQRYQKTNYQILDVLLEWDLLRRSLFEVLELESHLHPSERDAILNYIGKAVAAAGAEYNQAQMQKEHEQKQRLEATGRRLKELQKVTESALKNSISLDSLLFNTLLHVRNVYECETVVMLLLNPEKDRLIVRASQGAEVDMVPETEIPVDKGIAGKILSSGQPLIVPDITQIEIVNPVLQIQGVRSLMAVPLHIGSEIIGVLQVGSLNFRKFYEDELSLLQLIGDRIAIAIENARLVDQLKRELDQLNFERELRNHLVSTLTHDLRSPIMAAKTSAQIILRYPEKKERVEVSSARIVHSLDRVDRMIQDLLDSHRVQAGESLHIKIDICDLKIIIDQTLEELETVHGARFRSHLKQQVLGYWSAEDLRRVLENLASNAIKYGELDAPVTITVDEGKDKVKISVHNEGKPISTEDQLALFHPFSRTHSAYQSGRKGWGLGLSICRGIAEAHKGHISVESAPGKGTTFIVELPRDSRPRA